MLAGLDEVQGLCEASLAGASTHSSEDPSRQETIS
jgi:hypothetical protein